MAVDPVGLTGLIIAPVALLIALLQMMQALFATADGYRNCRPAIMGDWGDSKLTRRKFVPGEMHFETIYTVPYISMRGGSGHNFSLNGTERSREESHCKKRDGSWWRQRNTTSEMVTRAFLLDQIHNLGAAYGSSIDTSSRSEETNQPALEKGFNKLSWCNPRLSMKERSWDFTPSDVNKPLAVTNLASIAIIARRLGMDWSVFEPSSSLLQAEGNGMVMNSIKIPAVGTVLELSRVERKSYEMEETKLCIPTRPADALGFGIIQPWYKHESNIRVGTDEECTDSLLEICGEGPTTQNIRQIIQSPQVILGLGDIVGLTAQLMYAKGTRINRVLQPSSNAGGILVSSPASMVFQKRLVDYIAEHEQGIADPILAHLRWVQISWDGLAGLGAWSWEGSRSYLNDENPTFLDSLHDAMVITESWLKKVSKVPYSLLLNHHVRLVASCEEKVNRALRKGRRRRLRADAIGFGYNSAREGESMHCHIDYVEDIGNWESLLQFVEDKSGFGQQLSESHSQIVVAWFTMIFRGFCWYQLHYMVPGKLVGSQYWNSQQSVHIT